ncbi:uncharacterized protein LOC108860609 [Raphanus sativus]|uniref:Uncharacterized protein LOC108860609 n=1 Tax=Raphanus sativus TaxID=3726 RepID=A0A6J0NZ79_RAPSA|nr:uncharacterized protein LOC108860609 [Raphanus sativus]
MGREEQIAVNLFLNNNRLIHQFTQENNHVSYRGSIASNAVIYWDRKDTHPNL